MLLRVDNLHEKKKNITESHQGRRNFESVRAFARAIFVIFTRVTTLYSCYNFVLVLQLCTRVARECTRVARECTRV